jgi:hypothetical protein
MAFMDFHLAQRNVGWVLHPLDHPQNGSASVFPRQPFPPRRCSE